MRRTIGLLALGLLAAVLGCDGGNQGMNTAPLTEEQKKKVAEEFQRVSDEESSNSSVKAKKK